MPYKPKMINGVKLLMQSLISLFFFFRSFFFAEKYITKINKNWIYYIKTITWL